MASLRKQIRDAVQARLVDAVPAVDGRVYGLIVRALAKEFLPAIVVEVGDVHIGYPISDNVDVGQRLQTREFEVAVAAVNDAEVEDSAESVSLIAEAVQVALTDYDAITGLRIVDLRATSESFALSPSEEGAQGSVQVLFSLTVATAESDPNKQL